MRFIIAMVTGFLKKISCIDSMIDCPAQIISHYFKLLLFRRQMKICELNADHSEYELSIDDANFGQKL